MIFRNQELGRSIICVVTTSPSYRKDGFVEFEARDLTTWQKRSFGGQANSQAYHPSIEYIGEAAGHHHEVIYGIDKLLKESTK
jgi:hypothetical protein